MKIMASSSVTVRMTHQSPSLQVSPSMLCNTLELNSDAI